MKKRISQKVARTKYGIVISKLQHYNNYKFFLLDNGNVVDSDGDIRYVAFSPSDEAFWSDIYKTIKMKQ